MASAADEPMIHSSTAWLNSAAPAIEPPRKIYGSATAPIITSVDNEMINQ